MLEEMESQPAPRQRSPRPKVPKQANSLCSFGVHYTRSVPRSFLRLLQTAPFAASTVHFRLHSLFDTAPDIRQQPFREESADYR